jgi:hypothetical protein
MPPKRTMWGMHRLLLAAALVFVAALRASTAGPPTMRVDYYHRGKTIGCIGRPVTILTLELGFGASTATFSVVDAVLLELALRND